MKLTDVAKGRTVKIKRIRAPIDVGKKLRSLGVYEGKTVVIKNCLPSKGLILLKNGSGEIAVAHEIASAIEVEKGD